MSHDQDTRIIWGEGERGGERGEKEGERGERERKRMREKGVRGRDRERKGVSRGERRRKIWKEGERRGRERERKPDKNMNIIINKIKIYEVDKSFSEKKGKKIRRLRYKKCESL
uniref:Uncharacterized protein n=1 Tax=Cacopsylla melanoneura TaxID=428564 RepID=A0A8D8WT91_9HEMI